MYDFISSILKKEINYLPALVLPTHVHPHFPWLRLRRWSRLSTKGWEFSGWLLQSTCQSIVGQNIDPQVASDAFVRVWIVKCYIRSSPLTIYKHTPAFSLLGSTHLNSIPTLGNRTLESFLDTSLKNSRLNHTEKHKYYHKCVKRCDHRLQDSRNSSHTNSKLQQPQGILYCKVKILQY